MTDASAGEIRTFILDHVSGELEAIGLSPGEVPDDFDLLFQGAIDSLGLMELVAAIEDRFEIELDFEALDVDDLAVVGPFSRFIAETARVQARGR